MHDSARCLANVLTMTTPQCQALFDELELWLEGTGEPNEVFPFLYLLSLR